MLIWIKKLAPRVGNSLTKQNNNQKQLKKEFWHLPCILFGIRTQEVLNYLWSFMIGLNFSTKPHNLKRICNKNIKTV
jgi:hypothetical protein